MFIVTQDKTTVRAKSVGKKAILFTVFAMFPTSGSVIDSPLFYLSLLLR
jgi:hypothetical protein